jgi:MerR family transcriptional regulator, thiopeptide resistance regulator
MSFTVGQLAQRTGLTVRTLHHYHAIGLLIPSHRSDSRYRLYTQADLVRLYRILALQRLGLSLNEIADVLAQDGAPLPDLIDQQLAELDDWIEQAATLRSRLTRLRDVISDGGEPIAGEWLAAVELIAHYDRYCSSDELHRLLAHRSGQTDDWRTLVADLRAAIDCGLAVDSPSAQALGRRWRDLMMRTGGGDPTLVIKMKQAYQDQPDLRARIQMQSGLDAELIAFVTRIFNHAHAALWARHLAPDDVRRLRIESDRMAWLTVVAEMRTHMSEGARLESLDVQQALERWDDEIALFAGGDRELSDVVADALDCDADLQDMWAVDANVQAFVRRARDRRASGVVHG